MAPLPPKDQRHPWLRYHIEGYIKNIMHNYEERLETIFRRSVNQVHVLDFVGLTEEMRQTLAGRLRMVYTGDEGQELFTSHAWRRPFKIKAPCKMTWRQFIMALCLHTAKEMAKDGFQAHWLGRLAPFYVFIRDPMRRLCHRMISCSISSRGHAPKKLIGVDIFYLRSMDSRTTNVPHLLAQYLFRHAEGRKSRARLNICERIGDAWVWVALVPERQSNVVAGASEDVEDAPAVDEGDQADPAPVPQPPHAAPKTMP
uniref:Uncharacterized protein n=1 Tax=Tanacetum cinerariifolium TaxID=118510 RepID=A0A6L2MUC9_TANCI|nr:hypothetical protein [Tanacetum cinerariifolium]